MHNNFGSGIIKLRSEMQTENQIKKSIIELFLESLEKQKQQLKNNSTTLKEVELSKDLPENLRVTLGLQHEKQIIQRLQKLGEIKIPSKQEDIKFKIDGFIIPNDPILQEFGTEPISLQIKRRVQSGDDILYEVKKDFDNDIIGRDEKGSTDLYIVENRDNQIGVFKTKRIKRTVEFILEKSETKEKLEYYKNNPSKTGLVHRIEDNNKKIELRVTKGNPTIGNEGNRKLLAFINFELGQPIILL